MGKGTKKENNIEFFYDSNKNKLAGPLEISNAINEYFTTIGKNLADNIPATPSSSLPLPPINEETIYLHSMNRNEILKIIHDMKPKPGGIDRINAKTLQILAEFFADPLLHIINKSIELAIWLGKLNQYLKKEINTFSTITGLSL